mmetsp:Transcript_80462/g.232476  ORF Transcript_80462/g.232476 Transcript_80462/m.232476 type:complete len:204 (-) Transcript_80462:978-1589(-)
MFSPSLYTFNVNRSPVFAVTSSAAATHSPGGVASWAAEPRSEIRLPAHPAGLETPALSSATLDSSRAKRLLALSMPSAAALALSHSSSSSLMRFWSAARSSSTCSAISRCFCAIWSSRSARSRRVRSTVALSSVICWSFSAPNAFQFSMVSFRDRIVACRPLHRLSNSTLSFDKLLASTSKPAGPSSRMENRFSNCDNSYSNS